MMLIDTWQGLLNPMHASLIGRLPSPEVYFASALLLAAAAAVGALLPVVLGTYAPEKRLIIGDALVITAVLALLPVSWHELGGVLPAVDSISGKLRALDSAGVAVVFCGASWLVFRHWRGCMTVFRKCLLWMSAGVLFTFGRATIAVSQADFPGIFRAEPTSQSGPTPRTGPRVIIVIFDELDYTFAFASRPGRIHLPHFDSLRSKSVFALDAEAPDVSTEVSLPSYILGRPVADVVWKQLRTEGIRYRGETSTHDLSGQTTIFHDAALLDARSELVGFYLPYCRWHFASLLDRCTWIPLTWGGVFDGPVGIGAAVARQLRSFIAIGNRQAAIDRIETLTSASVRAIEDPSKRLVFLHLPVPHLPPIWDARRSRFTLTQSTSKAYLDNLELTDRVLGQLTAAIGRSAEAPHTFLIVTSDHPWRFGPIDGQVGGRIPFIVRTPQGEPQTVTNKIAAVRIRELTQLLLSGNLADARGIADWLEHPTGQVPRR